MSYYITDEVRDAVALVTEHLAATVDQEITGMPEGERVREIAVQSVIAWPVIDRVIRAYGVPEDVRQDLLELIVGKAHHNRLNGWDRGYSAGWDSALEVWGMKSCG